MPVQRFSSRLQRLDQSFLAPRLRQALRYDRIAGYFRSSILEMAGETLETVQGEVRVICNSDLNPADVQSARAAEAAMRAEWCASRPEALGEPAKGRFKRLYDFLVSGKLKVKVLPNERFGLIHGKAGVITLADGRQTAFIGSVNETREAWQLNYELVWEDDSPDAVAWAQAEFDALWGSPYAVPLAEFIIQDVERLSRRVVVPGVADWREEQDPAAPIIEAPVYRQAAGLWEHQKYFVVKAFEAHRAGGARFILADQVGLGKTLQLAMAAELMALAGEKPVLILAPKALIWQWQDELHDLLDLPSAVWTGKQWVDENEIEYPNTGPQAIRNCPRWIGIVSTSLITHRSEAADYLAELQYECIILDEAHRARRKNLILGHEYDRPEPNNLLAFMQSIAPNTKSLLLATATPVQLHPVEAWDLLDVLSRGSDAVLGTVNSCWRNAKEALRLLLGGKLPTDEVEIWDWLRDPFPPASEDNDYRIMRKTLGLAETDAAAPGSFYGQLRPPDKARLRRLFPDLIQNHNPFIRIIIRRTRKYLEETLNPETNEPYLQPVRVHLHGERPEEAIPLTPFLRDAYARAEEFCDLMTLRANAGFLRTLLLRRVGSSMEAGKLTAQKMLGNWEEIEGEAVDEEETDKTRREYQAKTLTLQERETLERFVRALEADQARDPKYEAVRQILLGQGWLARGCIIFSQYFDSIWWLAGRLSAELPDEKIGLYAGAQKSGLMENGIFTACSREELKQQVRVGKLRLLLGTDAASEGLNLQRLGTLINLDLPWNPSRLEQRKGRIQRIGQIHDTVDIYNLRYAGSVEDRVHELLSSRLEDISGLFGQLPDILEDVWVAVALKDQEKARQTIDSVPRQHPFELRYHKIEHVNWESCARVLDATNRKQFLARGWK